MKAAQAVERDKIGLQIDRLIWVRRCLSGARCRRSLASRGKAAQRQNGKGR